MTQERDQLPEAPDNGTAVEQAEAIAAQTFVADPTAAPAPEGGSGGGPRYYASRETLDREMAEIKDEVLRMGSLVASQIGVALESLVEHNTDKATAAIVGDGRINEAQRHISQLITTTIATQQPVARDLRFLLSLDH